MSEHRFTPLPADLLRVEALLDALTKPTYVWRMARAIHDDHGAEVSSRSLVRSARTRRRQALREVQRLLEEGGWHHEPPTYWLASTAHGDLWHLITDPAESWPATALCGRRVTELTRNWQTQRPVAYGSHWDDDSTTWGHQLCSQCQSQMVG